ncbi:MAG: CBS domain-containing protein [Bacteroidales bacterium]
MNISMLAKDLLSNEIPALRTSDTGVEALNWMEVFRISHLPIVNNEQFLGVISDTDIYDLNDPEAPLGNHDLSLKQPFVHDDQHVYEVMELTSRLKLTTIAVTDRQNRYKGLIRLSDLLHYFAQMTAIEKPGGIIVLEVNQNDYSVSEIAQIVEGNNAKILSLYIRGVGDSAQLEVTLKLNITEVTSILQTFNRYNYQVKASFMDVDENNELLEDRYEMLMRYLNT